MKIDPSLFETDHRILEIFADIDSTFEDWRLEPIDSPTLSTHQRLDENGFFLIAAKHIYPDGTIRKAFLDISMPERIIDFCYMLVNGTVVQDYRSPDKEIIPAIAIESFGNYEDFYSKLFPEVGIKVLRDGLIAAHQKWPIAMELGYILRDEKRPQEAIAAFSIASENGCPMAAVFLERAKLYWDLGLSEAAKADEQSFDETASLGEKHLYRRG